MEIKGNHVYFNEEESHATGYPKNRPIALGDIYFSHIRNHISLREAFIYDKYDKMQLQAEADGAEPLPDMYEYYADQFRAARADREEKQVVIGRLVGQILEAQIPGLVLDESKTGSVVFRKSTDRT